MRRGSGFVLEPVLFLDTYSTLHPQDPTSYDSVASPDACTQILIWLLIDLIKLAVKSLSPLDYLLVHSVIKHWHPNVGPIVAAAGLVQARFTPIQRLSSHATANGRFSGSPVHGVRGVSFFLGIPSHPCFPKFFGVIAARSYNHNDDSPWVHINIAIFRYILLLLILTTGF